MKPGSGVAAGPGVGGDRVADRGAVDFLDAGDDETDFAGVQRIGHQRLGREAPELVHLVRAARGPDADLLPGLERAVHDPHQRHDADVAVVPGVDDQRLQRAVGVALRRRDAADELLEQFGHVLAGLGADADGVLGLDADDLLDLLDDLRRVGRRQVDLVQDRDDFEPLLERRVAIGDALRLDALRGVHDQQRALAGGQRTRDFVREIDVPGRVDHVELVGLPVARLVAQRDALGLDGDAALALEVHRVEHLRLHLAVLQAAAQLDEPVGQRRLAVVDVRDDREVADELHAFR